MKRCRACNDTYRKGSIAYVVKDGKLIAGRVCQSCAKDSVSIIGLESATRCKCGKKPTTCGTCAIDVERRTKASDVKSAITNLRAMVAMHKRTNVASMSDHALELNDARIEGLESAIELLESGRY